QIPVLSVSTSGIEKNPGFKFTPSLILKVVQGLIYGDVFMKVVYRTRPYELVKGSANALHEKWKKKCIESISSKGPSFLLDWSDFKNNLRGIIRDFDALKIDETLRKPRVGIVGEILVKFMPAANNYLVELLESEGAEAVCPELLNFLLYCSYDAEYKYRILGKSKGSAIVNDYIIKFFEKCRKIAVEEFEKSKRFTAPESIDTIAAYARPIVEIGNQTGEGWFLTGEMIELIKSGVPNIVCAQPFACLPNHIVGKGVIKEIKYRYPQANIVAVDYDPGASEVNQLNRIKLMLSTAFKNLEI
ncbi:MAG: 2-hydroxyglutaryl-CoA dehydratase, partial [Lachnospiraceae bacterium]|nr:2-hydroxyglutaryl-CoA dehydratase [Lachnospiraceae bacterium]